jgi:hypothetical protein
VIDYLEAWLPFELETRYLSAYISKRTLTTHSCPKIISSVTADQKLISNICGLWYFDRVEDMRLWYGAMFNGPESRQFLALIRLTGLTKEQLETLFEKKTGMIGQAAVAINQEIANFFQCRDITECTSYEVAVRQFIQSDFTKQIIPAYS